MPKRIGVLALQGDVREHAQMLQEVGASVSLVKRASELESLDGLVIPGGESTTIVKLAKIFELYAPLTGRIAEGLPVFGTCAGLILLADHILDGIEGQETFGGINAVVRRNAFGHQTESFETELDFKGVGEKVQASFIRAPIIESVGEGCEPLATLADGRIVAVRDGNLLGISFHPEISGDSRVHRFFVEQML